jgi:hypothetical protein
MAETLDEFFSDEIVTDSGVHEEAALIHDYLAGGLTVETVVQRLDQSLRARDAPLRNGRYDLSEILEVAVVSVAEVLSETHNALVTLLGLLRLLSDQRDFESGLRYSLEERSLRYADPDPSLSSRDEARQSWTNLNHFAALVYKAGLQDLSALGIKTFSMSLKRGGWVVGWPGQSKSILDTFSALA